MWPYLVAVLLGYLWKESKRKEREKTFKKGKSLHREL